MEPEDKPLEKEKPFGNPEAIGYMLNLQGRKKITCFWQIVVRLNFQLPGCTLGTSEVLTLDFALDAQY